MHAYNMVGLACTQVVSVEGPVESWMTLVAAEMKVTLRAIMKESVFYYPKTQRLKWMDQSLGMCCQTGIKVWWTWEIEDVFRRVRLGDWCCSVNRVYICICVCMAGGFRQQYCTLTFG
jgi:hypothetical protein